MGENTYVLKSGNSTIMYPPVSIESVINEIRWNVGTPQPCACMLAHVYVDDRLIDGGVHTAIEMPAGAQ